MSDNPQPSLREILGVIRLIITGKPVPADFERRQAEANKALPGMLVRQLFSFRNLIFLALMALIFVSAIRTYLSN